MSIYNYKNFLNEEITPEEIAEFKRLAMDSHMKLYLSKRLMMLLKTVDHPISRFLLGLSRKNIKFDITFIDVTDDGMITYMSTKKVKKLEKDGLNIKTSRNKYNTEIWTSTNRISTSVGKFITKIFLGKEVSGLSKYNEENKKKSNGTDIVSKYDTEIFGNVFKAKKEQKADKFKVVYGKDILKYYLERNYSKNTSTLGASCMKHSERNKFMNLYSDNSPNSGEYSHVGMLIYLDDNDKILARSIIWFNSIKPQKGRIFMDRIYYSHDKFVNIFKDYAIKNGWLYKAEQTYSSQDFIDPNDNSRHKTTISFRIKNSDYNYYPYIDTLYYYTPKTGRISSKTNEYALKQKIITTRRTNGGYENVN